MLSTFRGLRKAKWTVRPAQPIAGVPDQIAMRMPGSVYGALARAGLAPARQGQLSPAATAWIRDSGWIVACEFDWNDSLENVYLKLHGVQGEAIMSLNGVALHSPKWLTDSDEYPITGALIAEINRLELLFLPVAKSVRTGRLTDVRGAIGRVTIGAFPQGRILGLKAALSDRREQDQLILHAELDLPDAELPATLAVNISFGRSRESQSASFPVTSAQMQLEIPLVQSSSRVMEQSDLLINVELLVADEAVHSERTNIPAINARVVTLDDGSLRVAIANTAAMAVAADWEGGLLASNASDASFPAMGRRFEVATVLMARWAGINLIRFRDANASEQALVGSKCSFNQIATVHANELDALRGADWESATDPASISSGGFQSWAQVADINHLYPSGGRVLDRLPEGGTMNEYVELLSERFVAPASLEDLVYYGQVAHAECLWNSLTAALQANAGIHVGPLADQLPCISPALIDSGGEPKAAYFALKRRSRPVQLILEVSHDQLKVCLANRLPEHIQGDVVVNVENFDGEVLRSSTLEAFAAAGETKAVGELDLTPFRLHYRDVYVYAWFEPYWEIEQERIECLHLLAPPNQLRLPMPGLSCMLEPMAELVKITICAQRFAPWVWWRFEGVSVGATAGTDNFFHLRAGEKSAFVVASETSLDELRGRLRLRSL